MTYHKNAVNNKTKIVKIGDSHSMTSFRKEQRLMFATSLDKIILTQVMRREN